MCVSAQGAASGQGAHRRHCAVPPPPGSRMQPTGRFAAFACPHLPLLAISHLELRLAAGISGALQQAEKLLRRLRGHLVHRGAADAGLALFKSFAALGRDAFQQRGHRAVMQSDRGAAVSQGVQLSLCNTVQRSQQCNRVRKAAKCTEMHSTGSTHWTAKGAAALAVTQQ